MPSLLFVPSALADSDTTRPTIVSISPTTGTVLGPGVIHFVVQAYDDNPGQLTLTFGDEDVVAPAPPYDAPESPAASNMNATLTVDTNTIPDGGYILHVRAKDVAGNSAEQSARYIVDKQSPSVPTGGMPNDTQRQEGDVQFEWQTSSDVTSPAGIRYDFRAARDSGNLNDETAIQYSHLESHAITIGGLEEGVWFWQVRAIDKAGNESGWSEVWNVLIDGSAPSVEVHTPVEKQLIGGKGSTLDIASDAFDANGLREYGVMFDGVTVEKITQPTNGVMPPISVDLADKADGEHVVAVYAIDMAGNSKEVLRTILLDRVGPDITTNLDDNEVVDGVVPLSMNSTDPHPGQHSIAVRNADGTVIEEGVPEYTAAGSWQYWWETTHTVDGTYIIQFRSVDAAGNESVLVRSVTVKNVTAAGMGSALPSVPLVTPLDVELSQPRLLGVVTPPVEKGNVIGSEVASDVIKTPKESMPQSDAVPIQSTESGWRLFGILWYWWVLFGSGAGVVAWQGWQFARSRLTNES